MKRNALLLGLICAASCTAHATKGVYKIRKHIEGSNLAKVITAIKAAGPIDPEEKNKLLELADDITVQRSKITMSGWDKTKLLTGFILQLFTLSALSNGSHAYNYYNYVASIPNLMGHTAKTQQELVRDTVKCGALGIIGLLLIKSGWRCNAARARLDAARKIEEAVEAAPQKSFSVTGSAHKPTVK